MQGLIGRKLGMTQVYDAAGRRVAVTVIEAGPCVVIQRKSCAVDGYDAVQLGFDEVREKRVAKPSRARFAKANVTPRRVMVEFPVDAGDELAAGATVTVDVLAKLSHVDVTGTTKGRGFQGVVKRHGMHGGAMTHGGHSKRRVGSIGANTWEARVMPGHRMPGHMGNVRATMQSLRVVEIRPDANLILLEGAVPGPTGAVVTLRKALKKTGKAS